MALRARNGSACLQTQPKLDDTLEVAQSEGEAEIGQRQGNEIPDAQSTRRDKRHLLLRTLMSANMRSYSVSFIRCMILDWMPAPDASGLN
jgi:hypothetical protein